MFKKIKLKPKNLKKYFLYSLILINIVLLYFMYTFINYYTMETFAIDAQSLVSKTNKKSNNLNAKDFDKIIKNIKEKTSKKEIPNNINNIFD